jgi:hypothetical protein
LSRQLWKTKYFDYKKIFFPDPFKDIFAAAFSLDRRMTENRKGRGREQMLRKLYVPTRQNKTGERRESHREKSRDFS